MLRRHHSNFLTFFSREVAVYNSVSILRVTAHNQPIALLQKYAVTTKEHALLAAASQGHFEDVQSLVNDYDTPLNTICQDTGLMPIELAFKYDRADCVASLVALHKTKKVYSELVDLLVKYTVPEESYPHKELALARAMQAHDDGGVNLFIKKYHIEEVRSLRLLEEKRPPIFILDVFWWGHQCQEQKHGNVSVSSFIIKIGHQQFKMHLSSNVPKGAYLQEGVLLNARSTSIVYPGDFGGVEQPYIITGLPVDFDNFLTVRHETLDISPFETCSTYSNAKMRVGGSVTRIQDKMRYQLHLFTTQIGACRAQLIETEKMELINSALLLSSKLKQFFRHLFIMRLNHNNPAFFPSNYCLKNSSLTKKIDHYFDTFVLSLAPFERELLAQKAESENLTPFIADMLDRYKDNFRKMLISIYSLQFISPSHLLGTKTLVSPEELANQYIKELAETFSIPMKSQMSRPH